METSNQKPSKKTPIKNSSCLHCETRDQSFFCSLHSNGLDLLEKSKTHLHFRPGQTLFYEGNPPTGVFCIQSGLVKLESTSKEGQTHLLHVVQKGGLIGYESLFAGTLHNSTATALEATEVCLISNQVIHQLTASNPELALKLLSQLASELRETETRLCHTTENSAQTRVAEAVLFLTDHYQKRNWTRREIGEWAGTTPETVMRTLGQFEEEKLIVQTGRKITILQRDALLVRAGII